MSNEQWLEDGDCSKCRRKNYCKKRCKRSRQAMRNTILDMFNKAMLKQLEQKHKDDDVMPSELIHASYLQSQLDKENNK